MYNNTHNSRPARDQLSELAHEGRRQGMTTQGAQFVAMACDPFSDERQTVIGMPDQTGGRSNVFDYRMETTVISPFGNDFDAHIALMPMVTGGCNGSSSQTYTATADPSAGDVNASANLQAVGGGPFRTNGGVVQICVADTGKATFGQTSAIATPQLYQEMSLPILVDPSQRARLISVGYEVINETEELHRSGAITDYRVDGDAVYKQMINQNAGGAQTPYLVGTCPPTTIEVAKQINGVTRAAADGSLVVGCYDSYQHSAEYPVHAAALFKQSIDPSIIDASIQYGDYWGGGAQLSCSRELPFLQSGSYATNLSPQTKLRVVLHAVVEVFPSPGDPIMALARDCPRYDPVAMEFLSILQTNTLPGYPLSWNGNGLLTKLYKGLVKAAAFGRKVLVKAAPAAAAGALALGHPEIAAGVSAVGALAKNGPKKKQNRKRN